MRKYLSLHASVIEIILDHDQDQQNVGPDLDPNCLMAFLKEFFENFNFQMNQ